MDALRTWQWRVLSGLPISFFLLAVLHYLNQGRPFELLWMCHVGNLILGLAALARSRFWVTFSAIGVVTGFPYWIIDFAVTGFSSLPSTTAHVGGFLCSLLLLHFLRTHPRRTIWSYTLVWYLLLQQVVRVVAPLGTNANLADWSQVYGRELFSSYSQFWVATTLLAVVSLWSVHRILLRQFSMKAGKSDAANSC